MPKKTSSTAMFKGTYADYHYHVGPSIRNRIQVMTKKRRNGRCANPECTHVGPLDAAHKIDRSRPMIIEAILSEYRVDESDIIECNLNEVFEKIEAAHCDFETVFDFICKPCHRKQDGKARTAGVSLPMTATASPIKSPDLKSQLRSKPTPVGLVEVQLFPATADAFKSALLSQQVKRVHVRQFINTGRIEDTVWKADNFGSTSNLEFNIRTGYAHPKRCKKMGIVRIAFALEPADLPIV